METPRGRYILDGPRVLRVSADGAKEEVVYSAEYLKQDGNAWVQTVSTESLGRRRIATQPVAMVYDDRTGNLVLAMGIQGVVVGTADGQWITTAVGWFEPSDFTFAGKTRLLFTDFRFWTAILLISACMAGFGLIASEFRLQDLIRAIPLVLVTGVVVLAVTAISLVGLFIFSEIMPLTPIVTALLGTMVVAMSIGLMPRQSTTRCLVTVAIGCLALLVLQRRFMEGWPVAWERRRGAWHGSAGPVRYYPESPPATAAVQRARTVPGAASPAPPGTLGAGLYGASFSPQACCRLSRKAPASRHRATW